MKVYSRICKYCNKEIIYSGYGTWYNAKSRNSGCKSCRSARNNKSSKRNSKREKNPAWKGYKCIPYNWFSKYYERERIRKKHEGSISIKYVYDLWIKQNKRCALSGIEIGFYDDRKGTHHTASIDRIDSSIGYHDGNIQIVHKDVNLMKNRFDQDYFISMCKLIVKNTQAPFEDIGEAKYNEMMKALKDVDLSNILEVDDNTNLSGELACAGGSCEIK